MKTRTILIRLATPTAVIASALSIQACGSESDEPAAVVATTGIVADITAEIAGEDLEVSQLIPDSTSPHDFQLSAQQRQELEEAALVVANGAGLEAGLPLEDVDSPSWVLVEHVENPLGTDPHVWMDPIRVAGALDALAEALGEVDPAHADAYVERAIDYAAELEDVDREIEAAFSSLPADHRRLVTSHDALGYLADRYGLEVIATAFPSSGAEAEASAAAIAEVEDAITGSGVPAIFAEAEDDPSVLERVGEATGVEVVTDLRVESPGSMGSYTAMVLADAKLIAEALGE